MLGLDDHIAGLGGGQGVLVALLLAVILGLRHATDPDHLAAVSTLALTDRLADDRRAMRLGLAWGAGHATTLTTFGLPVVLWSSALPETAQRAAELVIGALIVALAARLLLRHRSATGRHAARAPAATRRAAFVLGLAHGVGGSAGVSILLIGGISSPAEAVAALVLFAAATALSMALASGLFGRAVGSAWAQRRLSLLTPCYAVGAAGFGCWYALGAVGSLPSGP